MSQKTTNYEHGYKATNWTGLPPSTPAARWAKRDCGRDVPRCKQCREYGQYVWTRNMEHGPVDVWKCVNEWCTNYGLYFYADTPNDRGQARHEGENL
jgi:hypothetical protein